MKLFGALFVTLAFVMSPALALDFTLTCDMSDYGEASSSSGIEAIVPRHSVHEVTDSHAHIRDTTLFGSVDRVGSKITFRYVGNLKNVGETEVVFTFIKASGKMIARTKGLRTVVWQNDDARLSGKYVINGQCKIR